MVRCGRRARCFFAGLALPAASDKALPSALHQPVHRLRLLLPQPLSTGATELRLSLFTGPGMDGADVTMSSVRLGQWGNGSEPISVPARSDLAPLAQGGECGLHSSVREQPTRFISIHSRRSCCSCPCLL
jgi:hypothetical protein